MVEVEVFGRGGSTEECSGKQVAVERQWWQKWIQTSIETVATQKPLKYYYTTGKEDRETASKRDEFRSDLAPGINIDGRLSARWKL